MFDGVRFPANAHNYERTWPEAWTWVCDAFNLMARANEKPGMMRGVTPRSWNSRPCSMA